MSVKHPTIHSRMSSEEGQSTDDLSRRIATLSPAARCRLERHLLQKVVPKLTEDRIPHSETPGFPPQSFAQQLMWLVTQLKPDSPVYTIPLAVRLRGHVDVASLGKALEAIVIRHEALRTTFVSMNDTPVQVIAENRVPELQVADLSDMPPTVREAEAHRLISSIARQPFDLSHDLMLRANLIKLNAQDHFLILTIHHIAADGWSIAVLFRELTELYAAFRQGQTPTLLPLPIQYADYAVWQREWLNEKVLEEEISYWKQCFAGELPVLQMPTDRPRPAVQTYRGARYQFAVPEGLLSSLKALGQTADSTLFLVLLTAFKILLYRYTDQEDIIVGTPIAGRNRTEMEGLIGFFVNTLALRTCLSGQPTFLQLLKRVRDVGLGAFEHQKLPFEKLVEELNPQRDLSQSPLFQAMIVLENAPVFELKMEGVEISHEEVDNGTSKCDLTLFLEETTKGLKGSIEYSTDLFDATTVEKMAGHFQMLLQGIVANPNQTIGQLNLLAEPERRQILSEWNKTEADYQKHSCINELFEEQVELTPNKTAVVFDNQSLTYRELNERANRLAHYLQKRAVGPEVLVGICMDRSLDLIIALIAILKAGGAYVPLAPNYPEALLRFMLEDTGVKLLLTQENLLRNLPLGAAEPLCLKQDRKRIAQESPNNPNVNTRADNLAYVMYTSGSTGKPKGIAVEHRNVVRLVKGTSYASLDPDQVFLQFAPISFDASTFEIWGSLLNGARLVIMPPDASSLEQLGPIIRKQRVTTLWLTAGLFNMMVDDHLKDLRGVRQLLTGGDVLSVPHVRKALGELKDCRIINGYGPTENTTFTCCYPITNSFQINGSIPIGRPISNTHLYVLDRNMEPVPVGIPGELHIGGDGLARGYLNRPELTAKKFIPNRFSGNSRSRLYKTGDLTRYLPDGNIEFLGRMDHQVKVRGFRIELGEIEAVMRQHSSVTAVAVIVREDVPGEKRLVAYVQSNSRQQQEEAALRDYLKQKLPGYMVPAQIVYVSALPFTPNGKFDRRQLSLPDESTQPGSDNIREPRNEIESSLLEMWSDLLGTKVIGFADNFFEVGGHSLLAARLLTRIERRFGQELPMAALFNNPTIEQLAHFLGSDAATDKPHVHALQPLGSNPPIICLGAFAGPLFSPLINHLGLQQPFLSVGLRTSDLKDLTAPYRLEEISTRLMSAIRRVQPKGPYYLAGWCFDGVIAYETARQLEKSGNEVGLVVLFDAPNPAAQVKGTLPRKIGAHFAELRKLRSKQMFPYIYERLKGMKEATRLASWRFLYQMSRYSKRERPKSMDQVLYLAVLNYCPEPYPGRVVLFRSFTPGHDRTRDFGWKGIARDLAIEEIPGGHRGMFEEPNVRFLAERVRAHLANQVIRS